jgi:cephalosporin hydroxylase
MITRWHNITGFFDYKETYDNIIEHLACPDEGGLLIECGCLLGRSLCYLGERVKESGKPWNVIGIDNCLGLNQSINNNRLISIELISNVYNCGLQDIVSILVYDSIRAASLFPNNSISFLFLDTQHTYNHLSQEIKAWLPKIKINGIIAGDDVGTSTEKDDERVWPGVKKAVDELLPGWWYSPHDVWLYHKRK